MAPIWGTTPPHALMPSKKPTAFSSNISKSPDEKGATQEALHRNAPCLAGPHARDSAQTASLTAFTGRALMSLRAGLALNTVGSLVNGLMPLRALVAGFFTTTNFAKPGSTKDPVFLSSL